MLSYNTPEKRAAGGIGYVILSIALAVLCSSNPKACFKDPRYSAEERHKVDKDLKDGERSKRDDSRRRRDRHSRERYRDEDLPPRRVNYQEGSRRRTAPVPDPIDENGVTMDPYPYYHSPPPRHRRSHRGAHHGRVSSTRRE